jgi:hypothetical protein
MTAARISSKSPFVRNIDADTVKVPLVDSISSKRRLEASDVEIFEIALNGKTISSVDHRDRGIEMHVSVNVIRRRVVKQSTAKTPVAATKAALNPASAQTMPFIISPRSLSLASAAMPSAAAPKNSAQRTIPHQGGL